MARRTKRRQAPRTRRPAPAAAGTASRPVVEPRRVGGEQAMVRSVEMSLAPGAPARRGSRVVIEGGDPAIPLDRVPYFLSDLVRLGIVAAGMVVLLVIGAELVIPRFLH